MPSQAQKHVTHNEAIRLLDVLTQLCVESRTLNTPPTQPVEGTVFIVAGNGQSAWEDRDGELAAFQDGAWIFIQPKAGFHAHVRDSDRFVVFSENGWQEAGQVDNALFESLGIHTTADEINRISVSSEASLFSHEGAGHQIKINKNAATDTASLMFQTGYQGRSEMGTAGDNDFHLKVSPDGMAWIEAMVVDHETGKASFPATPEIESQPHWNWFGDGGRMLGSPEPQGLYGTGFISPNYLTAYNGSVFTQGPKFINNNANFGGTGAVMDPEMALLVEKIRPQTGQYYLRFGPEFFTLRVAAGSGTASGIANGGQTYFPYLVNKANPVPQKVSLNLWLYVTGGSVHVVSNPDNLLFVDGVHEPLGLTANTQSGWKQITRLVDANPATLLGYSTSLFGVYQTPGSEIIIALPALLPFHLSISPTKRYGAFGSVGVWR